MFPQWGKLNLQQLTEFSSDFPKTSSATEAMRLKNFQSIKFTFKFNVMPKTSLKTSKKSEIENLFSRFEIMLIIA